MIIDFALADDIPDTLADKNLLERLARNIPKGRKANIISKEAHKENVPKNLILAIYAIEISFRPWWVRIPENFWLFFSIIWWLLTGKGFRNLTIGSFQIGCHVVGDEICIKYNRKGNYWYPERAWRTVIGLIKLPFFSFNLKIAIQRVKSLWQDAIFSGMDFPSAIINVGTHYNGHKSYGLVLLELIFLMDDGQLGR